MCVTHDSPLTSTLLILVLLTALQCAVALIVSYLHGIPNLTPGNESGLACHCCCRCVFIYLFYVSASCTIIKIPFLNSAPVLISISVCFGEPITVFLNEFDKFSFLICCMHGVHFEVGSHIHEDQQPFTQ